MVAILTVGAVARHASVAFIGGSVTIYPSADAIQ